MVYMGGRGAMRRKDLEKESTQMPYDAPDPEQGFTPPYSIEIFEIGTWFEVENRNDLETAMRIASVYAERFGEKRVLVTDAKCRKI